MVGAVGPRLEEVADEALRAQLAGHVHHLDCTQPRGEAFRDGRAVGAAELVLARPEAALGAGGGVGALEREADRERGGDAAVSAQRSVTSAVGWRRTVIVEASSSAPLFTDVIMRTLAVMTSRWMVTCLREGTLARRASTNAAGGMTSTEPTSSSLRRSLATRIWPTGLSAPNGVGPLEASTPRAMPSPSRRRPADQPVVLSAIEGRR